MTVEMMLVFMMYVGEESTHSGQFIPINSYQSMHTNQHTPINAPKSTHINAYQSTHTNRHLQINTYQSTHTNRHTPINTHQSTPTTQHTPINTYHSKHTNQHTPIDTYQSTPTNQHTPMYRMASPETPNAASTCRADPPQYTPPCLIVRAGRMSPSSVTISYSDMLWLKKSGLRACTMTCSQHVWSTHGEGQCPHTMSNRFLHVMPSGRKRLYA